MERSISEIIKFSENGLSSKRGRVEREYGAISGVVEGEGVEEGRGRWRGGKGRGRY